MEYLLILIGLTFSTGANAHFDRIGTTYVLTIEKWLTSGAQSIGTLDAPTSSVKSVVFELLLTLKLANAPYCSTFPERGDRVGFGGFRKYQKCAQQMAAYRYALNERTGFLCDVALIIVTTPETTQGIFIDGDQLALYESRFLKRCQQFHEIDNETTDCSSQEMQEQTDAASA